ncbi:MAG: hypothetical protein HOM11_03360 [Methylococcales bacterium]|jgi:hypothetical protein|nr:hypothetical protein [Methylococcales bacterium]
MRQQGQLQQSLEMLSQKVHDRVDPLRRPETYCVRSNPLAYTTFIPNEKPVIKDPDIGTKAIKQLLQSLKDTT